MTFINLANQPMTQMRKNLKEIKKNPRELMIHIVSSMIKEKF